MNQLQIAFLREEYFRYATSDQGLDAETLAQFVKCTLLKEKNFRFFALD